MVQYTGIGTPKPNMNEDTEMFWHKLRETKKLHFQQCCKCGTVLHPPRPICYNCHSFDLEWVEAPTKGTIYSYVVYHRSVHPGFQTPYEVVLVELENGARIVGNMLEATPDELAIGMPVEVVIDDQVYEDLSLIKFKKI